MDKKKLDLISTKCVHIWKYDTEATNMYNKR